MAFWSTEYGQIYQGDAYRVLRELENDSVHCVVTSPPYWNLRKYFDGEQLGFEKTPEQYIHAVVRVFDEVHRVLRPDGTVWLNIDDAFSVPSSTRSRVLGFTSGIPEKNLLGLPWRVALRLQEIGWYLRCDVIWNKPNSLPEPTPDRPTRAHEYLFLLSKSPRYFYDRAAIYEPIVSKNSFHGDRDKIATESGGLYKGGHSLKKTLPGKNKRSVWNINTEPTKDSHYATFPSRLVSLCIQAGTSAQGCCSVCGKPIKRIIATEDGTQDGVVTTNKWAKQCKCIAATKPAIVLDPFMGRGTTLLVAQQLGRHWVGIDANPEACEIAKANMEGLFENRPPVFLQQEYTTHLTMPKIL